MSTDVQQESHVSEKQYWIVFAVLVIITGLEVAWSYMGFEGPALVVPLILMMLVKFLLVAGVFMHLYFDAKLPHGKIFAYIFLFGIVVAIAVYTGTIATFDFRI